MYINLYLPVNSSMCWASPVAQMVKNLPAMQKTQVWSPGGEDPLEKGMATLENSMDRGVWWAIVCGVEESDTLSVC